MEEEFSISLWYGIFTLLSLAFIECWVVWWEECTYELRFFNL